jgi:hypothetical protein
VLRKNARLFMIPGMYHCSKGPGPNFFDALTARDQWVEDGRAPETIVATKYANDDPTQAPGRMMPLCSFPTQARYTGTGDVNRRRELDVYRESGSLADRSERHRGADRADALKPTKR